MESTVLLAALAIVASTTAALVWIIKYLFTNFKPVMDNLVKVTEENTQATRNADIYLRERNGRDNDFHKEIMAKLQDIPVKADEVAEKVAAELKRVGDATAKRLEQISANTSQNITEQHVEKQIVEKRV